MKCEHEPAYRVEVMRQWIDAGYQTMVVVREYPFTIGRDDVHRHDDLPQRRIELYVCKHCGCVYAGREDLPDES